MNNCNSIYDSQEDSVMLEKHVKKLAYGKVLDIGTGSGIQAIAASMNDKVESVLGVDIQKGVIEYCQKNIKNRKISFKQSDLFENIEGVFDTIIFNPPYLPQELKLRDLTLEGGKKGYEVVERFLNDVNGFLKREGVVLLVFSSLTKKDKVEQFMGNNLLDFSEIDKDHIFFEDIYIYKLEKSALLKSLEKNSIKKIKYFSKGHRGLLYTGILKKIKVAIKIKNPKSGALERIQNESKWLKRINKKNIGPKVLIYGKDYFAYKFIDGAFILDYLSKSDKKNIKKALIDIFEQMYLLDSMNVNKGEMHHPVKHVLVENNKPFLIDFERMRYTNKPSNVTQFCQFLTSGKVQRILKSKKIEIDKKKLLNMAKSYKKSLSCKNFNNIIELI
jgi:HemK-related putative methylase